MNIETHVLRAPTDTHSSKNGFMEGFTEPDQITEHDKQTALDAHRRALFVLNHKKRTIPSFETMKANIEESNMLVKNSEAIQSIKEDHLLDLQNLYAYQADEYHQEMLDRYLSNDESWYQPDNINDEQAKLQEILYTGPSKDALLEAQWQSDIEQLRYTYLSQLLSLQKERHEIQHQQESERKIWEKMFPTSKEDFEKKPKDVQLRAARFLIASSEHEKEKMIQAYGWAWRQVLPLQTIFQKDGRFAAEIRGMVMADNAVSDPRRARA